MHIYKKSKDGEAKKTFSLTIKKPKITRGGVCADGSRCAESE